MLITIPKEVKEVINEMPFNKTVKNNTVKIYTALFLMSSRKNKYGYFSVPSDYLKSINLRYYKIIDHLEEKNIIEAYTRQIQDDNDIFNSVTKKYYDVGKGICMKYKFLLDVEKGDEIDVDMVSNKYFRWHQLIQDSLVESGYEIKIKRDTYGRRVHHSAIRDYKKDFKGFYTIDSICSQPRLLYLYVKERGLIDVEYFKIFENDLDFYTEVAYKLKLNERDDAKELFMYWVNSNGYVPCFTIHLLFPQVSKLIKSLKKANYKDCGSVLQRIESKIWIDDLLNNIPCDFALPIHDSVIIKEDDADAILEYCKNKYPQLRFKKELIN